MATDARSQAQPYDEEYFRNYCGCNYDRLNPHWLSFFGNIAEHIIDNLHPRSVLDMGCAKGFLVEALRERGVEAFGIDASEYAISQVRPDLWEYCRVASVTDPLTDNYDLITCIEVLEHVPDSDAQTAIRAMCAHTDTVLFSSTPADFAEATHVNVQPILHWLERFRDCGFVPDLKFDAACVSPQAMLLRRTEARPSDELLKYVAQQRMAAVERNERENAPVSAAVAELDENLTPDQLRALVRELQQGIVDRDRRINSLRGLLEARDAVLQSILKSKGWRLLDVYRRARNLVVKEIGLGLVARVLRRRVPISASAYQDWIRQREKRATVGLAAQEIAGFGFRPKISIIMPVYNTRREYLDKAIESVRAQYYDDWELCVCDDGSSEAHVRPALEEWARRDARVKVVFSPANEGISAASNRALELASGEFVGFLDHDDELTPDALFEVVKLLQQHADADVIYSDEDKLATNGRRCDPFFKPDWSPEYLLSCMYTCHFGVYRRAVIERLGGFRRGFEGSQDYDLMLRASEYTDRIVHVPKVLYHWRKTQGSTAARRGAKTFTSDAGRRALEEHLQRRGIEGRVVTTMPNRYRVRPNVVGEPLVSVIIPNKDHARLLGRCIGSIETKTTYRNYEIIVADNGSTEPATKELLARLRHRVVPFPEPFNYSRINNFAARYAKGEYLLFLNDDTEVRSPEWMTAMLELCQLPGVGAVGAKLLFPNGRVQHAGVVLGLGGVAGHPYYQFSASSRGYFDALHNIRNFSAVTAACLMVRRSVFEQVGGFDDAFPLNFNDVDFCLRVRRAGYRIVWTPFAELYHYESATRVPQVKFEEMHLIHERWGALLLNDPFYSPNLTLQKGDYSLRM